MANFSLEVDAGADARFLITVVRDGVAQNLASSTLEFTANLAVPDDDAPVQQFYKSSEDFTEIEVLAPTTNGQAVLHILDTDTDAILIKTTYRGFVKWTEPSGRETIVTKGDLTVVRP